MEYMFSWKVVVSCTGQAGQDGDGDDELAAQLLVGRGQGRQQDGQRVGRTTRRSCGRA